MDPLACQATRVNMYVTSQVTIQKVIHNSLGDLINHGKVNTQT